MGQGFDGSTPGKLRTACRALFWQAPTKEEAARFGLSVEEASPKFEVWPDCWESVSVFTRLGTQWRTAQGYVTGLDYCAIGPVFDLMHISEEDRPLIFDDLRVMEGEALKVYQEKAKRHG